MTANGAEEYLISVGAIWTFQGFGAHASFMNGAFHSDYYFNSDVLNRSDVISEKLVDDFLSHQLRKYVGCVDWVGSYLPACKGIAEAVARYLKCQVAFLEDTSVTLLNRAMKSGEKVVMVSDDIYSGESLRRVESVLLMNSATVQPDVFTVGNFSGRKSFGERSIHGAFEKSVARWPPSQCPLCSIGSTPISVRDNWGTFTDQIR